MEGLKLGKYKKLLAEAKTRQQMRISTSCFLGFQLLKLLLHRVLRKKYFVLKDNRKGYKKVWRC